jgi:hypothetical protein
VSARSQARRRLGRLLRFLPLIAGRSCVCGGLCRLDDLKRVDGGSRWCGRCGHVLGKKVVAALFLRATMNTQGSPVYEKA